MLALDAGRFDAGLAPRLEFLSDAAFEAAQACASEARRNVEIPAREGIRSPPPRELRPNVGRRGPRRVWQRLDAAVAELDSSASGTDLRTIARAYEHLGEIAAQLAAAITAEDRARAQRADPRSAREAARIRSTLT